ncbi:hypothetical protein [Gorillibacterium timonense]|uniref:hypothetical protein n=1 Tax=Gorillibacterium timonense TaxID=1689269 RepID=UPI00071CE096|nr:hypothetical protein [Gorillibacterium timonense]
MNNEHDDWFKGLEQDPFPQKGFQPELKRRIMRELDRKPVSKRPHYRFAAIAGACTLVICLLIILRVQLLPPSSPLAEGLSKSAESPKTEALAKKEIQSVLLLGLRQDKENNEASYRSLMFANQDGRVKAVAAGSGILIPYGQVFWKLDNAADPAGEGKSLHIEQAGKASIQAKASTDAQSEPLNETVRLEKLLYAGNKYLSFETKSEATAVPSQLWNVDLKEYAKGAAPDENRLNLTEFTEGRYYADSWTVFREAGNWKAAYKNALDIQPVTGRTVHSPGGIGLTLLSTELSDRLVNHDTLDRPWNEIVEIEPNALDSVTSPDHDMMAIFTESSIKLYEYSAHGGDQPLLTVSRNKGEQLVMVQWALEKYASKWISAGEQELNGK